MRMYDLIAKKRDGFELTSEEIAYIVSGYTNGSIPDYQMSSFLMAVYFQGMNERETSDLTMAMAQSGDMLDLSLIGGIKADKHSTGGVGDKVTLVLAPMAASLGVPVAKMSGRGLGHTGGTIDKLESIPGFTTSMDPQRFIDQVNSIGIALTGQTGNLVPADKRIYALRDATATVESMPLIAASVMSKKIAAGAQVIILDVKCGSGAFMKNENDAVSLARLMVDIGDNVGRRTMAVVTDMDEPLGYAIGNSLEVVEAIETLKGRGSKDVLEVCIALGSLMLEGSGLASSDEEARSKLKASIRDGSALAKFREWISAQGGDVRAVDDYALLPEAKYIVNLVSPASGYVKHIRSDEAGAASMLLGSGRADKNDTVDHAVGITIDKKTGDYVSRGDILAKVHANDADKAHEALQRLEKAYELSDEEVLKPTLIKEIIK